jgi:predicted translin family RNA/ssDNA-binding protein
METQSDGNRDQTFADAEAHIKSAHKILKTLRERIGEHPEIGEAITKLEMALNVLAVKTGGML